MSTPVNRVDHQQKQVAVFQPRDCVRPVKRMSNLPQSLSFTALNLTFEPLKYRVTRMLDISTDCVSVRVQIILEVSFCQS